MTVNELINNAIYGLNDDWPVLYKIRYIYLKMGLYLKKDTDFFFSVDSKLEDQNLSIKELGAIYNNLEGRDGKVICRSASYLLHLAYERAGIKSKMVKSNNNITNVDMDGEHLDVNHWMLAVYDEFDKAYFVTLSSDLPYVQMGMRTKHFGSNIPYIKETPNGDNVQVYDGDEIKHTVLTDELLEKIDKEIGYIKMYYPYDKENKASESMLNYEDASFLFIRDAARNNKLYYEIETENTFFFKSLMNFEAANYKKVSFFETDSFSNMSSQDWEKWIRLMCEFVEDKINYLMPSQFNFSVVLPNWNYELWLKNLCIRIKDFVLLQLSSDGLEYSDEFKIDSNFSYKNWSRKLKKKFKVDKNEYEYDSLLLLVDKMNALVSYVKSPGPKNKFMDLFNSLAYHFIDRSSVFEKNIDDGFVSSHYIANKFFKVFCRHFGCNQLINDFNKMDYSEQIVIIKNVIVEMFPEINSINSCQLEGFNPNYQAILNRIHIYPIKSKEDGSYSMVFNIVGDSKHGDYYYFYNPKTNVFQIANIPQIHMDYIIVSERFKSRLESIEDVEYKLK